MTAAQLREREVARDLDALLEHRDRLHLHRMRIGEVLDELLVDVTAQGDALHEDLQVG